MVVPTPRVTQTNIPIPVPQTSQTVGIPVPQTSQTVGIPVPQTSQQTVGIPVPQTSKQTVGIPLPQTSQQTVGIPVPQTSQQTVGIPTPRVTQQTIPIPVPRVTQQTVVVPTPGVTQSNIPIPVPQTSRQTVSIPTPGVTVPRTSPTLETKPYVTGPSPPRRPFETPPSGPIVPSTSPRLVPRPEIVPVERQQTMSPVMQPLPEPTSSPANATSSVSEIERDEEVRIPIMEMRPTTPSMASEPVFRPTTPPRTRSPPVTTMTSPRLVSEPVFTQIDRVNNHSASSHMDCCVCYDTVESPNRSLKCGHMVCADCTKQLHRAECPTCRQPMEGGYFTHEVAQSINRAAAADAKIAELTDMVYSAYVQENPVSDFNVIGRAARDARARSFSDAYATFLTNNADISRTDAVRLFSAFERFVDDSRRLEPNLSLEQAALNFMILGVSMLENPSMSYEKAYAQYSQMLH